jgi:hypothetical protein
MYHFLCRYLPASVALVITALAYAILLFLIIMRLDVFDGGFRYLQI